MGLENVTKDLIIWGNICQFLCNNNDNSLALKEAKTTATVLQWILSLLSALENHDDKNVVLL